jgi:hypothetical protein
MAEYKPNASRQTKGGKAMVSADELKSFRNTYGQDKTLRDLLNMDKGLSRKGEGPKDSSLGTDMTKKESKEAADSLARIQSKSKPGSGQGVGYQENTDVSDMTFKKGGKVSSASSRADGCAVRGKTRGMIR